ncbi:hypothetical protein [Microlunatus ginsengisoli]|uniref:Uncharacterized protein n=1 Tax=Microlunatus ginsengisoli TaxID=363863 RepID=A0ABP6ZNX9_9ACTN
MSAQRIDAALKRRVLDALIEREAGGISFAAADIDDQHDASEAITDDTVSFDDTTQSSEELGLAAPLAEAAAQQRAGVQRLRDLDSTSTDVVGVGALVGFDGDRFVAGVVAAPFECDGVSYEGLSADSPNYAAIVGLRARDTFTFRGVEHRIDFVV